MENQKLKVGEKREKESMTKNAGKGVEKEKSTMGKEGSHQEHEPIIRRSALMRTPPTKSNLSVVLNQINDPGGETPREGAGTNPGGEDMEIEVRSVPPAPFIKRGLIRSPFKKLVRTGSFSKVEKKIKFGKVGEQSTRDDERKRKRSDSDEPEERKNSKGKKTAIQLIKLKAWELKEEIENEVLQTSKMETLIEELCTMIDLAEAEEAISIEESKDGGILRQTRIVNGKIKKTQNYDQFLEVEQMDWPEKCYTRTRINSGNFPTDKGDIIFLRNDEDPDMTVGVARRLKENFPEISQFKENSWETLVSYSRRESQKEQGTAWEKRIHVGKDAKGEELYTLLTELKTLMTETNRERGVLPLDKGREDTESLIKMLECIFKDTSIIIEIYSHDLARGKGAEAKRGFKNNALMVKTSKGNYAETLRKVKEQITKSGKNMDFRKVRSTRDGNMLIELNEGDDGSDLSKVIKGGEEGLETRILDKNRNDAQKYIIRDLDALITKEEIENILKENAEDEREKEIVRVISIRRAGGDTQNAIIEISTKQGDRINRAGGIALGLIKSTLKTWVDVVRCYRCWELGHRASKCNGVDRTVSCLRCGQADGHSVRDCPNADYCPLCQREGHRAGSGACPKMRLAIANLRKQQVNRRRYSRKQ